MITPDPLSPESHAASKTAGTPAQPATWKLIQPAKEFAAVIQQALRAEPEAPRPTTLDSRRPRDARSPHVAPPRTAHSQKPSAAHGSDADYRQAPTQQDQQASVGQFPANSGNASDPTQDQARDAMDPVAAADLDHQPAGDASAASQNANIVPFPVAPVIIPFPGTGDLTAGGSVSSADVAVGGGRPAEDGSMDVSELHSAAGRTSGKILQFPAGASEQASDAEERQSAPDEDGIDVMKLGLKPVEGPQCPGDVELGDFNPAQPSSATHLPGEAGASENSSQPAETSAGHGKVFAGRREARKTAASTELPFAQARGAARAEATGISAARQSASMDSLTNTKLDDALAGRKERALEEYQVDSVKPLSEEGSASVFSSRDLGATEWHVGRPVA